MKKTISAFLLLIGVLFLSCSVESVEPEFYGTIKGRVLDSKTHEGIASASITTNQGTEAVLTKEDGSFRLTHIPTGDYLVKAEKNDYKSNSVRITVHRNDSTSAQILLNKDEDKNPANDFLDAEVYSFYNDVLNSDTTYVDVNYSIANNSGNQAIPKYEIYFKIYTSKDFFLYKVKGDSLDSGQMDVGSFRQYIRNNTADSVVITDIYVPS